MLNRLKKITTLFLAFIMTLSFGVLIACSFSDFREERPIVVVYRDASSGTRTAIEEMLYEKEPHTFPKGDTYISASSEASVVNNVRSNPQAIGYEGLAFITKFSNGINILSVEGVEPTLDNLTIEGEGKYPLSRPLNIVYRSDNNNHTAEKFIEFIHSVQGWEVITDAGFAYTVKDDDTEKPTAYVVEDGLGGQVNIVGSTTIDPLMKRLAEKFKELQPGVNMDNINATGSGASTGAMKDNTADIGMVSSAISDSVLEEMQSGSGDYTVITLTLTIDAIVIVVHESNSIGNITKEQLKPLYDSTQTIHYNNWQDLIDNG